MLACMERPKLDTPSERLRWARKEAGYPTATSAAKRVGETVSTYTSHENGTRGISSDAAQKYARVFKIPFDWLMTGRTQATVAAENTFADRENLGKALALVLAREDQLEFVNNEDELADFILLVYEKLCAADLKSADEYIDGIIDARRKTPFYRE